MNLLSINREPRIERRKIAERRLVLTLPAELIPPSTNRLTINTPNGRANATAYERWKMQAGLLLNRQITGYFAERVDILVEVEDCHPSRDASNCVKSMEDLLVKLGVIADDKAKHVRRAAGQWSDIEGVRITVEVAG